MGPESQPPGELPGPVSPAIGFSRWGRAAIVGDLFGRDIEIGLLARRDRPAADLTVTSKTGDHAPGLRKSFGRKYINRPLSSCTEQLPAWSYRMKRTASPFR